MPRADAVQPLFHDTVTIPVAGRPEGMRVIVTRDGDILPSLVEFFQWGDNDLKGLHWQIKAARAVGLLYDYVLSVPAPADVQGQRSYLSGFVRALTNGTVALDGSDPTGLGWRPLAWGLVEEILRHVNAFADYCALLHDHAPLNPLVDASWPERIANYNRLERQNAASLLKHLGVAKQAARAAAQKRHVSTHREPMVAPTVPPAFPAEAFPGLLNEGFRRRGRGAPWERWNLRDQMLTILQRHGGVRASEALHLFVTDVVEDRPGSGHAEVRLYHPQLGRFTTYDRIRGGIRHLTRAEYLAQEWRRLPRNVMTDRERAGWKDLMLDVGKPHYYAVVRWFPREAGQWFWRLFEAYRDHVLPPGLGHPYLFVNLDAGEHFGRPYTFFAYRDNLQAAVRRLGLPWGKAFGTTTHGLRHRYGQDLEEAKVPVKVIQTCMHHKSPLSQLVYTRPDRERVQRELDAARARIARSAGAERDTAERTLLELTLAERTYAKDDVASALRELAGADARARAEPHAPLLLAPESTR